MSGERAAGGERRRTGRQCASPAVLAGSDRHAAQLLVSAGRGRRLGEQEELGSGKWRPALLQEHAQWPSRAQLGRGRRAQQRRKERSRRGVARGKCRRPAARCAGAAAAGVPSACLPPPPAAAACVSPLIRQTPCRQRRGTTSTTAARCNGSNATCHTARSPTARSCLCLREFTLSAGGGHIKIVRLPSVIVVRSWCDSARALGLAPLGNRRAEEERNKKEDGVPVGAKASKRIERGSGARYYCMYVGQRSGEVVVGLGSRCCSEQRWVIARRGAAHERDVV